jgi:hypothetical protein
VAVWSSLRSALPGWKESWPRQGMNAPAWSSSWQQQGRTRRNWPLRWLPRHMH